MISQAKSNQNYIAIISAVTPSGRIGLRCQRKDCLRFKCLVICLRNWSIEMLFVVVIDSLVDVEQSAGADFVIQGYPEQN